VGGGATDAAQPSQAANAGGGAGQTPQNTQSVESLFGRTINASDVSHTAGLQNGVLGEDVGLQTLNQETGLTFESLQNNSNNGADGVVIDPSTNTIWVAEVKSSQNGVSAAANATGDPAEKLDQWVRESLGPSKSSAWQSQPAGNPALAQQIRDAIDAGYQVKGVQVQVGVPAPGSTGTPQVKITPWTSN
jgi:filamentous hemagglutinin